MKILKNKLLLAAIIVLTMIVTAIPVFAVPHNIPYSFHLGLDGANSYLPSAEARYRETVNTNNCWKVRMDTIYNDPLGIATYWIARNADHQQVSKAHNVHAGTGSHLYPAYASASQTKVVLAADNENDVIADVEGVWDEENN